MGVGLVALDEFRDPPADVDLLVLVVFIRDRDRNARLATRVCSLTRPVAVLITTRSPSRSTQTGDTCGEPSGITVARYPKLGASTFARALSLSFPILVPPLSIAPE